LDPALAQSLLAAVRHEAVPGVSRAPAGELLAAAEQRAVAGLVARRLALDAEGMDEATREAVLARVARERRHRAIHHVEIERAATALAGAGIPTVVLKGPPLGLEIYEDPVDRDFRDIDLLVPEPSFEAALDALGGLGYRPAISPKLASVYRRHHYHWLLGGTGRARLELHWDLSRPDDPFRLDPETMLAEARPVSTEFGWKAPPRDLQLLHAALDVAVGGATDLKRLIDVDRLLRAGPPPDPVRVAQRARECGMERALSFVCELSVRLLGTPAQPLLERLADGTTTHLLPAGADAMLRGTAPENEPVAAAWLRYELSPPGRQRLARLLRRSRFDRARLAAEGAGPLRRLAGWLKRLAQLAAQRRRVRRARRAARRDAMAAVTHPSSSSSRPEGPGRGGTGGPAS
jgi:hypothetical protein